MVVFILLLLLVAALTGILGAVLKLTLIVVVSLILSIVVLAWIGVWYTKRRLRRFQREVEARIDRDRRRRGAHDVGGPPLHDGR